jgi:hypothetical protein
VAADPAKGVLLVEIAQMVEAGGDSCNQPSSLKLFQLECAIMECHGLDIHCGPPREGGTCDEMGQAGDFCRHFATCGTRDGRCALLDSPKFTQCKTCFEACLARNSKGYEACDTSCRRTMGVP